MKACEVILRSEKPLSADGTARRIYPHCGKLAVYFWTPRGKPRLAMPVCRECGDQIAGNFRDELRLL